MLLLVGAASFLVFNASAVGAYFREHIHVTVILKKDTPAVQAVAYQRKIEAEPFVKTSHYVSVQEGEAEMREMLGEDFLDVFETSPVPSSVEVTVRAAWMNPDSLLTVHKRLSDSPIVEEVDCRIPLVETISVSFGKVGLAVLLGFYFWHYFFLGQESIPWSTGSGAHSGIGETGHGLFYAMLAIVDDSLHYCLHFLYLAIITRGLSEFFEFLFFARYYLVVILLHLDAQGPVVGGRRVAAVRRDERFGFLVELGALLLDSGRIAELFGFGIDLPVLGKSNAANKHQSENN